MKSTETSSNPKAATNNYLLRNIPPALWIKAKHRAVDNNESLRDLILNALHEYVYQNELEKLGYEKKDKKLFRY